MNAFGFMIDKNGKISFFGEWVHYSKFDFKSRNIFHTESFEDKILNTDYFKSLNLIIDKKEGE